MGRKMGYRVRSMEYDKGLNVEEVTLCRGSKVGNPNEIRAILDGTAPDVFFYGWKGDRYWVKYRSRKLVDDLAGRNFLEKINRECGDEFVVIPISYLRDRGAIVSHSDGHPAFRQHSLFGMGG